MEIAPQPIIIRLQPDMILGGTRLSSTAALSAAELGLRPLETTEFFTAFTPLSNESFLANSLPLDLQIAAESAFCTPALFSYLPQLPPADQFIRSAQPMNCAYPSPVIESDSLGDTDDFAEFVTLDGDEHPQLANALEEKSAGADVHGENSRTELSWPDTPESLIIEPVLVDTVPAQNRPKQAGRAKRRTAAKAAISPTMVRKYLCEDCGAKFLTSGHLSRHRYKHLDPEHKPHKCTVPGCTRSFSRSDNAKAHAKSHFAKLQRKGLLPKEI